MLIVSAASMVKVCDGIAHHHAAQYATLMRPKNAPYRVDLTWVKQILLSKTRVWLVRFNADSPICKQLKKS
jgi:hypothetical protein